MPNLIMDMYPAIVLPFLFPSSRYLLSVGYSTSLLTPYSPMSFGITFSLPSPIKRLIPFE